MDTEQCFCDLFGYGSYLSFLKITSFLFFFIDELQEILFQKLKYQISVIDHPNEFFKFYHIGMGYFSHRFDFGQLQAFLPGSVLLLQFFDGDKLLCLDVLVFVNIAEAALPQLSDELILFHPIYEIFMLCIYFKLFEHKAKKFLHSERSCLCFSIVSYLCFN